jgi:hypothetical protein
MRLKIHRLLGFSSTRRRSDFLKLDEDGSGEDLGWFWRRTGLPPERLDRRPIGERCRVHRTRPSRVRLLRLKSLDNTAMAGWPRWM